MAWANLSKRLEVQVASSSLDETGAVLEVVENRLQQATRETECRDTRVLDPRRSLRLLRQLLMGRSTSEVRRHDEVYRKLGPRT